jgi:Transposase DDE domain group 1
MGRFETEWLASDVNLASLMALSGARIDQIHARKRPHGIVLDMDSSESPTHGRQEGAAWNWHFGCNCYHPLFVFNQFGDLERSLLRPGHVHSAADWRASSWSRWSPAIASGINLYFRADAAFAKPEIYEWLE